MRLNKLKKALKNLAELFSAAKQKNSFVPSYRVLEIFQSDDNDYVVEIQMINKNVVFKAKPEEILSKDNLVDQFSPRDIRTLTYLGYLGINSPKYKILAKRLSENDDKLIFALKKRGEKNIIIKTAAEIIKEEGIVNSLDSKDARLVGYTVASESAVNEKKQKEQLKKMLEDRIDSSKYNN